MNAVETYLADLEAKVRRLAGKRRAANVVAELRGHLTESVEVLVAKGMSYEQAQDEAVANLGDVDPRDYVPLDGAPTRFNRMVRMRAAFWSFFILTSVTSWLFWLEFPNHLGQIMFAYMVVGAITFAAVGAFGARWTLWPAVKGCVYFVLVNGLVLSFLCVDMGRPGAPFPQLRSVVASEHKAAQAAWAERNNLNYAELSDIKRVSWLFNRTPRNLDFLPNSAIAKSGKYRYPSETGFTWNQESADVAFVTAQWQKNGIPLASRYSTALDRHANDVKYAGPALSQTWTYVFPRMMLSAVGIGWVAFCWCVVFGVVGDILWSTGVLIWRLLRRKAVEA